MTPDIPFSLPTRELVGDAAICALNDGRERGLHDHQGREYFITLAAQSYDRAADPTGEFAPARPDAQP